MPFRITQDSISRTTLSNIQLNYKKMQEIQEKLSSGKKINRPSDDPVGTRKLLGFKTEELQIQQFLDNIKLAKDQINFLFDALENVQENLGEVQELAVQAGNDTNGPSERNVIASEIDEYMESILQFSNMTDSNGRYVFSGTKTLTTAFSATRDSSGKISSVSYNGNNETIKYQIGNNSFIQVNQPGGTLFKNNKVFSTLVAMRDELKNDNFNIDTFLSKKSQLESAVDNILTALTKFGARANRLDLTENRLENSKIAVKELASYTEDADLASLITELKNQENVLQASLQSGARIIQPSLLDFLG